ncbi:MAG: prepilin peptidase [Candidatus Eremiobacteraeota bacterium]|nr:prepilin peptidase [Candidatus Eremiobacteraeota bacterium]MBV8338366.1 prepilin peptidase [Candidatus Eremiobacteraeota bacterium]MBV8461514.1 prepilin peptidase [Candidatus Eremiobacteraeota bacterium]
MPSGLLVAIAGLVGLAIGSFLNVVIYRVPRDESISFPPSHCTVCGHLLSAGDNVPVISWLVLRGRCRYCGDPISSRYPLVELMTAALFVVSVLRFGASLQTLAAAVLSAYLIVTVFVDIDHLLILDVVTVPVAIAALIIALVQGQALPALAGAATGAVLFGMLYIVTRGTGLGLGDVKLAACLGLFIGWPNTLAMSAASVVIGAIIAVPLLVARKRRGRDVVPFGPFLVLGALIMTFAPALVLGPYQAYQEFLFRRASGL